MVKSYHSYLAVFFILILGHISLDASAQSAGPGALKEAASQLAEEIASSMKAGQRKVVAVMPLNSLEGGKSKLGSYMSLKIEESLFQYNNQFTVRQQNELQPVYEEIQALDEGSVTPARLGQSLRRLGAEAFVVGTVTDLGSQVDISISMYNVEGTTKLAVASALLDKDDTVSRLMGQPAPNTSNARSRGSSPSLGSTARQVGPLYIQPRSVSRGSKVAVVLDFYNGSNKTFLIGRFGKPLLSDNKQQQYYYDEGLPPLDLKEGDTVKGHRLNPHSSNDVSLIMGLNGQVKNQGDRFGITLNFEMYDPETGEISKYSVNFADISSW